MNHTDRIREAAYYLIERMQLERGVYWSAGTCDRLLDAACMWGRYSLALAEDIDDDRRERPWPTRPWVISSNPHMSRW